MRRGTSHKAKRNSIKTKVLSFALSAMLFALCSPASGAAAKENPLDWLSIFARSSYCPTISRVGVIGDADAPVLAIAFKEYRLRRAH